MSTKAVPVDSPTNANSHPVSGSVQPQMSLPLPPPISACERYDSRSMSRHGYGPANPSVQVISVSAASRAGACTSARVAQPHEHVRPLESRGQIPPLQSQ